MRLETVGGKKPPDPSSTGRQSGFQTFLSVLAMTLFFSLFFCSMSFYHIWPAVNEGQSPGEALEPVKIERLLVLVEQLAS